MATCALWWVSRPCFICLTSARGVTRGDIISGIARVRHSRLIFVCRLVRTSVGVRHVIRSTTDH